MCASNELLFFFFVFLWNWISFVAAVPLCSQTEWSFHLSRHEQWSEKPDKQSGATMILSLRQRLWCLQLAWQTLLLCVHGLFGIFNVAMNIFRGCCNSKNFFNFIWRIKAWFCCIFQISLRIKMTFWRLYMCCLVWPLVTWSVSSCPYSSPEQI